MSLISEVASFSSVRAQIKADYAAYQKQPKSTLKPWMVPPIKPWDSSVAEYLTAHNLHKMGEGLFGTVYSTPSYSLVLKVFSSKDYRYLWWYQFMLRNQGNKYIPNIRGKLVKITPDIYAVRMEKLSPVFYNYGGINLLQMLIGCYDPRTDTFDTSPLQGADKHFPNYRDDLDLKKVCKFLHSQRDSLDIHSGNLMKRGSQLVIIDPIATEIE